MNYVKRAIHAENVYKYGLSGKNVTVAIMDTGIAAHKDFDSRILAFRDFCEGRRECYDDTDTEPMWQGLSRAAGECLRPRREDPYMPASRRRPGS